MFCCCCHQPENPFQSIYYASGEKRVENPRVSVHFLVVNWNSRGNARGLQASQAARAVPAPASGGAAGLSSPAPARHSAARARASANEWPRPVPGSPPGPKGTQGAEGHQPHLGETANHEHVLKGGGPGQGARLGGSCSGCLCNTSSALRGRAANGNEKGPGPRARGHHRWGRQTRTDAATFSLSFLGHIFGDRLAYPSPLTCKALQGRAQGLFTFCVPRARHGAGHKAGPLINTA